MIDQVDLDSIAKSVDDRSYVWYFQRFEGEHHRIVRASGVYYVELI
jgi:hypothetical protein